MPVFSLLEWDDHIDRLQTMARGTAWRGRRTVTPDVQMGSIPIRVAKQYWNAVKVSTRSSMHSAFLLDEKRINSVYPNSCCVRGFDGT